jgi:hypothetical protein
MILFRTRMNMVPLGGPVNTSVQSAQPYNVDTLIVDGRMLKRKVSSPRSMVSRSCAKRQSRWQRCACAGEAS